MPQGDLVYDAKVNFSDDSTHSTNHSIEVELERRSSWLVRNPSPNQPFIFDIDGRSLEFGREDFCLITGFRFGKLVKNDVEFNQLDDDDAIRVCLLLALDYVFMGQELRHGHPSTPVLRSATRGSSNSKSVHTRVQTEVRHEVHVLTEVRRFVDKEEVRTQVVDEEDVQKRAILAKTVKEQEQMIAELQQQTIISHNVPVGVLDQPSMEGSSHGCNDDQVDKNCNDVPNNFLVDGPEYQSVEGGQFNDEYDSIVVDGLISLKSQDVDHIFKKSFVMDDPEFKAKDNEEGSYSDSFLSIQQVKELINDFFTRHLLDWILFRCLRIDEMWNQPSLDTLKECKTDVSHTKRGWLSDDYPLYYADGVKYGVPWFAKSIKKVYFPVNESDSHWVLGELDITSGVITFYDSLGGPLGGVETCHFWLEVRQILEFQFPLYLDSAEVFEKKKIDKASYSISF
ncbi:phospholipase-like protein [Tanacetum coccineum]|uniref:Phospholipase-like protein n=1 Tax=Tanacetum coccineum TaxID=301880 RepID=A0ABQ5FJE4_9ASTR